MKRFLTISISLVMQCSFTPLLAQHARCERALTRAHLKLASLYEASTDSSGYSFHVIIDAVSRGEKQRSPEQEFRMTATKRELLIESATLDSYQNDSVKITIFKTENRIYVTPANERAAIGEYMKNFSCLQQNLVSQISVVGCSIVKKIATIDAVTTRDTLGLHQVKTLKYSIALDGDRLTSLQMSFAESQPLESYSIRYTNWLENIKIPLDKRERYKIIASRSARGEIQIDSYKLIDTRKKTTP